MLTLLLHTRNRPEFLARALSVYTKSLVFSKAVIIVLDSSDELRRRGVTKVICENKNKLNINLMHHDEYKSLAERLHDALKYVKTTTVLLAADDDFYFDEWVEYGVKLIKNDPTLGVVHGSVVRFKLMDYVPYGRVENVYLANIRNPRIRWLEDESALGRLTELGRFSEEWASTGWYALLRTQMISTIVEFALNKRIDEKFFEKFLHFAEVAMYKAVMIPAITLARQDDSKSRPHTYSSDLIEGDLLIFKSQCRQFLEDILGYNGIQSEKFVDVAFKSEFAVMRNVQSKNAIKEFLKNTVFGPTISKVKSNFRKYLVIADYRKSRYDFPPNVDKAEYTKKTYFIEHTVSGSKYP